MIRTRPNFGDSEPAVFGSGQYTIAITQEQLELIAAFTGMIKLGARPYENAAFDLLTTIEELTGDVDFPSYAINEIQPTLRVRDPNDLSIIEAFDADTIVEFLV